LWQVKQIIHVHGELSVDRVNVFGGSPSGSIFIAVNSLLAWIARFKRQIESLVYVDDSFGVEEAGEMTQYAPYEQDYPSQQACLLEFWDEVGIPHKRKKQLFGPRLAILGIDVDVDNLTFTLSEESRARLLEEESKGCTEKGERVATACRLDQLGL
jgi:hypothetical protein